MNEVIEKYMKEYLAIELRENDSVEVVVLLKLNEEVVSESSVYFSNPKRVVSV